MKNSYFHLVGIDPIGTRGQKLLLVVDLTHKRPNPRCGPHVTREKYSSP
jgi:hypothetical protein